ncbi:MAG: proteasome regulatory particle subunit [Chaenotheca gracillima]|nr:MAG: proteasome regulatory particle subunit [Chaenotheca gracillima]
MSVSLPSDEVAEDYKNSLEDLNQNSRYEISNLTIIAKENMDHALAISRVLETHIRTAPPSRKLTALYVLDSIVKNVGTPYTLFFGRNLYQTFMNAYTLVDNPVRKKLEEMLKTWKEPVPGSLDPRPVFPAEVTRSIENALIKARTAAVQLQQQQIRGQPGRTTPYRNTPTPPNVLRQHDGSPFQLATFPQTNAMPPRQVSSPFRGSQNTNGIGSTNPSPQPSQLQSYMVPQPTPPPSSRMLESSGLQVSIEVLNENIANLIAKARVEFAGNPLDPGIQQRLKALFDLQTILQSQTLPYEQLKQIHDQVTQLSMGDQAAPAPPSQIAATNQPSINPQPAPQQQASLESLLPPSALAAFMASVAPSQQSTPPPPPPSAPTPQQTQQPSHAPSGLPPSILAGMQASQQDAGDSPLMIALRAAGMLPPAPSTPTAPHSLPNKHPSTNIIPPIPSSNTTPRPPLVGQALPFSSGLANDVTLSSKSLKISRPQLIRSLYESQPNQCKTCARRFQFTPEDKRKKARHLDWHFRVNVRMADAAKRGQSRSWYVDEMEWINSRESDEDDQASNGAQIGGKSAGAQEAAASATTEQKRQWIPVPNDPSMVNSNCPICQEKFETLWHDEAQEWVWMDAIKVGGRVYHASCHAEATKDGVGTPLRGVTPDPPVLGKRKAEENDAGFPRAKMKRESE